MALEIFESVTSTMDVAREYLLSGRVRLDTQGLPVPEGILAREQTAGRGQRGRAWYAPPGEALCVTYFFRGGPIEARAAGQLSLLAGLAAAQALEIDLQIGVKASMGAKEEIGAEVIGAKERSAPAAREVGLKWPNDLLLHGKKVGGILIEIVRAQDGHWIALIGVGINVNVTAFPPELAPLATSLLLEGYGPYPVEELAYALVRRLAALADLRDREGFSSILAAWSAYDQTAGRLYATEWEGETVTGMPEGVDATGALLLRLSDGRLLSVLSASALQAR